MMNKRNRSRMNVMKQNRNNNFNNNGNSSLKDDRYEVRLKSRSYYQQMYEKYVTLARECLTSGDKVELEGYYQYAEHYLRQLNERIRYDQEQNHAHRPQHHSMNQAKTPQERENSESLEQIACEKTDMSSAEKNIDEKNADVRQEKPKRMIRRTRSLSSSMPDKAQVENINQSHEEIGSV